MRKLKGFTLIELLVVVAIIGILSTVVVVNLSSSQNKARISKVKADISEISNATEIILTDSATFSGNSANLNTSAGCYNCGAGSANNLVRLYKLLGTNAPVAAGAGIHNQGITIGTADTNLSVTALGTAAFTDTGSSQLIPSVPAHPSGNYGTTGTGYGYFWMGQNASNAGSATTGTTKYSIFAADPANLTTNIFYCNTGRICNSDTLAATTRLAQ